MNIEVIRYRLPVYWAHALINDDYTGLLDNEEQEIRNFLKRVKADPVSVDWKTEGFYWYNNVNNTPGECVDFIFHRCNN
jgi:molybdopterin-guanine dinucleotide biosynthesis protein A